MKPAKQSRHMSFLASVGLVLAYAALMTLLPEKRPAKPATSELGKQESKDEPLGVHKARANEPGRGRTAVHPGQIPWKGWKDILWRTYGQIQEDRLLAISAGVVFFALLAIFPAITALVSLYGMFASSSTIQANLSFLSTVMPGEAAGIVNEQVARVVSKGDVKLGFGVLFGLAIALWSANGGMKAMIDALNIVSEEEETRGFFKLNLISLLFTIGAVGARGATMADTVGAAQSK